MSVKLHWRVKVAIIISTFYALLWGVRFMPPQTALFFWQRGAWSLAVMLIAPVLLVVVYLLALTPFPGADSRILLVLLGIVILGCNLLCGVTAVDWLGISVKPAERCKVFASDQNGLRVTLYRETLAREFIIRYSAQPDWSFTFTDNQAHVFLENTTDGGSTWAQTVYYTDQSPDIGDFCDHVQAVGDTFFVVAIGEMVLTSADNGARWYKHELSEVSAMSETSTGSYEYRVADVTFTDPQQGSITFTWHENTFDYGYHEREITLVTRDGGQTWNVLEMQ